MLQEGDTAPDFSLSDETGNTVRLKDLKGHPVVLYFYPKDDTSGCTSEAKDFSSLFAQFEAIGATVLGVSPDSADSHAKFKTKYDLAHHLLADPDKTAALAFGVWVEKSMYGKKYMGVERSSFLIDAKGKIAKAWRKVKVPGHGAAVLAATKALS